MSPFDYRDWTGPLNIYGEPDEYPQFAEKILYDETFTDYDRTVYVILDSTSRTSFDSELQYWEGTQVFKEKFYTDRQIQSCEEQAWINDCNLNLYFYGKFIEPKLRLNHECDSGLYQDKEFKLVGGKQLYSDS